MIKDTSKPGAGNALTHWATPVWCVEGLLEFWPEIAKGEVLEPSAGEGGIVRPLVAAGAEVAAIECRQICNEALKAAGAFFVGCGVDFIRSPDLPTYRSVVANPPYRPAPIMLAHVKRALKLAESYCAQLLPISFLSGGSGRGEFWRESRAPTQVLFFEERPRFADEGGMFECCWLVWAPPSEPPRRPAMIKAPAAPERKTFRW